MAAAAEADYSRGDPARQPGACLHAWPAAERSRCVLLVVHGMSEHGGRYARLARALQEWGCSTYACDLPGHGAPARADGLLGHVPGADPWRSLVEAVDTAYRAMRAQHPGVPAFVLGHSMGSFLVQHWLRSTTSLPVGVILSATSASLGRLRAAGALLMRLESALLGASHRSALAEALSFRAFNRRFRPNRTRADWLSRDRAEVDAYLADPLCGQRASAALWRALLTAGAGLTSAAALAPLPESLPILLISGGADPVNQNGRGASQLADAYRRRGLRDVELRIYAEARHELLNELNRAQVTEELSDWLRAKSAPPDRT